MATTKFYIVDEYNELSDGRIVSREKVTIGQAWNQPAPDGIYINCSLEGHWIITDEEMKLLNEYKKHERNNNKNNTTTESI